MKERLDTLKWAATAVLIVGSFVNSLGMFPLGPWILVGGGALWLVAALAMRDRQLIVTNGVMMLAGLGPLLYRLV